MLPWVQDVGEQEDHHNELEQSKGSEMYTDRRGGHGGGGSSSNNNNNTSGGAGRASGSNYTYHPSDPGSSAGPSSVGQQRQDPYAALRQASNGPSSTRPAQASATVSGKGGASAGRSYWRQQQQQQQQAQAPPQPQPPLPNLAQGTPVASRPGASRAERESSVKARLTEFQQRLQAVEAGLKPSNINSDRGTAAAGPSGRTTASSQNLDLPVQSELVRLRALADAQKANRLLAEAESERRRIRGVISEFEPLLRGPQIDIDRAREFSLSRDTWLAIYAGRQPWPDLRTASSDEGAPALLPDAEAVPKPRVFPRISQQRLNLLGGLSLREKGISDEQLFEIAGVLDELDFERAQQRNAASAPPGGASQARRPAGGAREGTGGARQPGTADPRGAVSMQGVEMGSSQGGRGGSASQTFAPAGGDPRLYQQQRQPQPQQQHPHFQQQQHFSGHGPSYGGDPGAGWSQQAQHQQYQQQQYQNQHQHHHQQHGNYREGPQSQPSYLSRQGSSTGGSSAPESPDYGYHPGRSGNRLSGSGSGSGGGGSSSGYR
ncbi:hypothetical protein V8E36_001033 [Tilletia maclaganii]